MRCKFADLQAGDVIIGDVTDGKETAWLNSYTVLEVNREGKFVILARRNKVDGFHCYEDDYPFPLLIMRATRLEDEGPYSL